MSIEKPSATATATEIAGRGHALHIDGGWREVAGNALTFVSRFTRACRAS